MSSLSVKLVSILDVSIHARVIPSSPLSLHQVIFVSISILRRLGEYLAILTTGGSLEKTHIVLRVVVDICLFTISMDVMDIVPPLFFIVSVTGEVHVVVDVDGAPGTPIGHVAMESVLLLSVLTIATAVGGLAIAGLFALVLTGDGALFVYLEHLLAGCVVGLLQLRLQVLLVNVKLVVFWAWYV